MTAQQITLAAVMIVMGLGIIAGTSIGTMHGTEKALCGVAWPEKRHAWHLWSGCIVEHNGRWIPESEVPDV